MDQIRLWMLERFCPVVLVASTNAVEEIVVARNGLSLVDLLRAFQQIPRLDGESDNLVLGYADDRNNHNGRFFHSYCSGWGDLGQGARAEPKLPCSKHSPHAHPGGESCSFRAKRKAWSSKSMVHSCWVL
jgi:hypothetical protein